MRLELTLVGLLVKLANYYSTRGVHASIGLMLISIGWTNLCPMISLYTQICNANVISSFTYMDGRPTNVEDDSILSKI